MCLYKSQGTVAEESLQLNDTIEFMHLTEHR